MDLPGLIEQVKTLRQASDIPGLSLAVVKDQEIILAMGLGYANLEQQTLATADTPYNIASVTKPLAATVAMQLVEAGVLDLDQPMAEYSEWAGFCSDFSEQPSIFAQDLKCEPSVHTLRHLLSHTAVSTPGDSFSYNPVLYSWASRPIAAAAGTSFSVLVQEYVLEPVAMDQSARTYRDLPLPENFLKRLAMPYKTSESGELERAPLPPPQGDGAAGGIISTVLDLARFDIAFDSGQLISAESRAEMMSPTISNSGNALPYGLGWYVEDYQGTTLNWHSGWWDDAYSALYLKIPEHELSFILLANSEGVWWENPMDKAEIHRSEFVQAFLQTFLSE